VTAKRVCPHCGAAKLVRLVFGMPTIEVQEKADKGLVALAGCVMDVDSDGCVPSHRCLACNGDSGKVKVSDG